MQPIMVAFDHRRIILCLYNKHYDFGLDDKDKVWGLGDRPIGASMFLCKYPVFMWETLGNKFFFTQNV